MKTGSGLPSTTALQAAGNGRSIELGDQARDGRRRWSKACHAVALSVLAAAALPAFAFETYVDLFVGNIVGGNPQSTSGTTSSTLNDSYQGGSATGHADSGSGTINETSQTPANGASVNLEADSDSGFSDFAVVTSAAAGIGYLDYRLVATTSPHVPYFYSSVFLDLYAGSSGYGVFLDPDSATCNDVASYFSAPFSCTVGTSIAVTGSIPFVISAGVTGVQLIESLESVAEGSSATTDATATFDLRLPEGATYTSASGGLFATATPLVSQVPEPAVPSLLLSGLTLLTIIGRKGVRGRRLRRATGVIGGTPVA